MLCLGTDLHYAILTNKDKILPMCKKIQEVRELNNLEKIQDSVQLCLALMQLKVLKKVQPAKNMYSDINSKEAEKPKQIEVCV